MNHIFGGKVEKTTRREDGPMDVTVDLNSPLFKGNTLGPFRTYT